MTERMIYMPLENRMGGHLRRDGRKLRWLVTKYPDCSFEVALTQKSEIQGALWGLPKENQTNPNLLKRKMYEVHIFQETSMVAEDVDRFREDDSIRRTSPDVPVPVVARKRIVDKG